MTNARKLLEKHLSLHIIPEEAAIEAIEEAVRIEREECAKFLENSVSPNYYDEAMTLGWAAHKIRARGNEGEK